MKSFIVQTVTAIFLSSATLAEPNENFLPSCNLDESNLLHDFSDSADLLPQGELETEMNNRIIAPRSRGACAKSFEDTGPSTEEEVPYSLNTYELDPIYV